MRQVAKKGLLTAMATGSVLASTAGYAYAAGSDAHGTAANSPGVGSGNSVQAPVDIPVNACGNTINVIGLLNPAYGNDCSNQSGGGHGGGTHAGSGSSASGSSTNSPGVGSGNHVQAPISAPVDACGNSVNVVGIGNPAFGNDCGNHGSTTAHPPTTPPPSHGDDCPPDHHTPPPTGDHTPPPTSVPETPSTGTDRTGGGTPTPVTPVSSTGTGTSTQTVAAAAPVRDQLASTGASGLELLAPTGALLLIGGGVLYRRSRVNAGR
ncbi:chaplin [Kitasatospora cinereorecta]|uniref:Chaplin n=1 Tax=Kitasatospora cinereorecta TaxID=285560 RepID=A0ABW0VMZ4_9ACTN